MAIQSLALETAGPTAGPPSNPYPRKVTVDNAPGCSLWQLGEHTFSLRWRDGLTRKQIGKRRSALTVKHAKLWAVKQARRNAEQRASRAEAKLEAELYGKKLAEAREVTEPTIEAEFRGYYSDLASAENRSKDTLGNVEEASFLFLEWCRANELVLLSQLDRRWLSAYLAGLKAMRKRNGKPYKISTVNQWLKYPRRVLRLAVEAGRAPHLNGDILRDALKHTPIAKRKHRQLHGIKQPRALKPKQIRQLLRVAMAYDAEQLEVEAARPVAPDLAMVLLSTFRRREYTFLRCEHVQRVKRNVYEIAVPEAVAKGYEDREIELGITPVGQAIALELVRNAGGEGWLSMHDYESLGQTLTKLIARGAPKCSLHVLRATCVTYQLGVRGLNPKDGNTRAGHSMAIADADYYDPPREMASGRKTLEGVMRCRNTFARVLAALKAWPSEPRNEVRASPSRPRSQALLSKADNPQTLSDALTRFSERRKARQK